MKHRNIITLLFMAAGASSALMAQEQTADDYIIIEPLFEYPVAPEELVGLQDKSDYLMEHFWDKMDFKSKKAIDQNALNDAFRVYTTPMRFADAEKVETSVNKLIADISKNAVLSLQFAKAAEEALYSPRADVWNDRIFLKFVDNILRSKDIKKERKTKYERLHKILNNSMQGSVPAEFDYITPEGKTAHYHPNGVITLIEFGTPDCDDCRLIKLKLETNVKFSSLVDRGKINVLYINTDASPGWQEKLKDYPEKWHVGTSEQIKDLYDMRLSPTLYVIDREGKVAVKNIDVETAMQIAATAAEQ